MISDFEFQIIIKMNENVLTKLLGVRVPIMLAGMGGVSYAELVAAVSNSGG